MDIIYFNDTIVSSICFSGFSIIITGSKLRFLSLLFGLLTCLSFSIIISLLVKRK